MMASVAVVILTHNESLHIGRAIEAVRAFAAEIFVIDSFSTDGTQDIARNAGAVVLENPWVNYSKQFDWALTNAPISTDWIMRLDADEIVGVDLAEEIVRRLPTLGPDVVGATIDRRHIFMDRWIRHGGRFPLTLLRLWRRGHGRLEERWMDEHVVVWGGRTVAFHGAFYDHNLKDLTFFTAKHNSYATREAIDALDHKYALLPRTDPEGLQPKEGQAARRRSLKHIYNRIPFWLSTLLYFLFRYIVQLGFLDGRPGIIYHFLQGYWYRFLVGAKIVEYERHLVAARDNDERLRMLSALTGYDLSPAPGLRNEL